MISTLQLFHLASVSFVACLIGLGPWHVEMRYEPVPCLLSRPNRFHCINVSPWQLQRGNLNH